MGDAVACSVPDLPPLRDYQERGYADLRAAVRELLRAHPEQGCGALALCPTGGGKTRLGLEAIRGAIAKGNSALWIAPRNELVSQPIAKLHELGWHAVRSVAGGRVEGDPNARLTVASIQTLVARDYAPPADVVIFDEARHYVAAEWGKIAGHYARAARIGLDATPARADGSPLGDLFERIVPISSVAELTSLGWLVPSVIYGPADYRRELADTPLASYQRLAPGKRAIVFCTSRAEAKRCAEAFTTAGYPAEAVDSHTPLDVRRGALDRVRSGETLVLCNVALFTEGLDLVELECIIVARGVAHESTWLQIGGRGLRPSPRTGKTHCIVIDLRGHRWRYGFLDDERTWHLDGEPIRRPEALPPAVQCRRCLAWHRGGGRPCPLCGARLPDPPPPKVTKRELLELRRERVPKVGDDWELWQSIVHEQREHGRSGRWAAIEFKARTGRFPKWGLKQVPERVEAKAS